MYAAGGVRIFARSSFFHCGASSGMALMPPTPEAALAVLLAARTEAAAMPTAPTMASLREENGKFIGNSCAFGMMRATSLTAFARRLPESAHVIRSKAHASDAGRLTNILESETRF